MRKARRLEQGTLKVTWPVDAQLNERAFIERVVRVANTLGLEGKELEGIGHDPTDRSPNFVFKWKQRVEAASRLTVSPSESESGGSE